MVDTEAYTFVVNKVWRDGYVYSCSVLEFPNLASQYGDTPGEAIEAMVGALNDAPTSALMKNPPYGWDAAMDRIFHHKG